MFFLLLDSCSVPADVAFVVDSSTSIRDDGWQILLDFLADVSNKLEITDDLVHVGATRYSRTASVQFTFNSFRTNAGVASALRAIRMEGGSTDTAAGILTTVNRIFGYDTTLISILLVRQYY